MSESPPPLVAGNAPVGPQETLTPETIDRILADFRSWLEHMAATLPDACLSGDWHPEDSGTIDLHTLLGQFIALRHEVNLQTKAVRAQQEQNAEALRQSSLALAKLTQTQEENDKRGQQALEEQLRPVLKTLLDLHDALSLACREVERVHETVLSSLDAIRATAASAAEFEPKGLFGWLASGQWKRHADWQQRQQQWIQQASGQIRQLLDSLITGYMMSLGRVERALEQHHLEPIPCLGRAFDPELMEVVEVVAGGDQPAGLVVDEVRRGYLWNSRVFRFAQVRVVKE